MATHSSILAWRIPWTEEPGGLQSMWSQSQTQLKQLSSSSSSSSLLIEMFNLFTFKMIIVRVGFTFCYFL